MRILWLNWKDLEHPLAGGAEVVTEELLKRLAQDGHEVTLLTSGFKSAQPLTSKDGYTVVRVGGKFSVYYKAYRYYIQHVRGKVDLVVDEINTVPFFASLYAREPVVNFFHQLARQVWFYEMPFPFSAIGYLLEPLYVRLINKRHTIVVSESTKQDLLRHGFMDISLISEGIQNLPLANIETTEKASASTILSLGSIRSMKRTLDIVKAFELAKKELPTLELIIAGSSQGAYGERVRSYIESSPCRDTIHYLGPVPPAKKLELMKTSHALAVASVKEGWCLVVTECNSQGTPAVVYNVDGLRDSVRHNQTGLITSTNNPAAMAAALISLLTDEHRYKELRLQAWEWSKTITFKQSYTDLLSALLRYGITTRLNNRADQELERIP